MDRPPPVRFLGIGAQKAGTTALHHYLGAHPDIEMPAARKELHFFDDEGVDWRRPDYGAYHGWFGDPGKVWGEVTPIYMFWPPALERIRAYNPDVRLIILLRDPVERAWSGWRMHRRLGHETLDFAEAIRTGRERLGQSETALRRFSYVERGFYGAQLERVFSLFPRDQVFIEESRNLDQAPDGVLARLWAFLDLPDPGPVQPQRRFVSAPDGLPRPSEADVDHLRGVYADDDALLRRLAGIGFG